jgi:hypothetical protein
MTARYPSLYELNTRVRLTELSETIGRPATLDDISDSELDRMAEAGFTWVWLLSVWDTGVASPNISRSHPDVRRKILEIMPVVRDEDIAGSGFAIRSYTVPTSFGGPAALARLRERLRRRGLRLMLDFVPNHTAIDHRWVDQHPDYYIQGTETDLRRSPRNYVRVGRQSGHNRILAHGRDPYFPGWVDVLQLNYGNLATQAAIIDELLAVAEQCDGVRCDMAMLILPDVFERTWGLPAAQFWPKAIAQVRARTSGFCFLAEVYWDLEPVILQQGFDYAYDKRLYDRLRAGSVRRVREHLQADLAYQSRLVRFLENHDEPRAAATFPTGMHEAAAIITYLSPGVRFFHHGQLEGRRKAISPHVIRSPQEPVDEALRKFYHDLLKVLLHPSVADGDWQVLDCQPAWEGNWTWDCYVAWCWRGFGGGYILAVVNYAPHPSQCYVRLPTPSLAGGGVRLNDLLSDTAYDRDGDSLIFPGLYLDLPAWGRHVFSIVRPS